LVETAERTKETQRPGKPN